MGIKRNEVDFFANVNDQCTGNVSGNLCAFDWNSLPMGREFDGKFLKNVNPHPMPCPPLPPALH